MTPKRILMRQSYGESMGVADWFATTWQELEKYGNLLL
jgi:hypothetical protein